MSDVNTLLAMPRIFAGLKEQKSIGDDAFNERVNNIAQSLGFDVGELVTGFDRVVADERAASKRAEFDVALKGQTLSASMVELFNQGFALASELTTDDQKVTFSMVIERTADSETPVIRGAFKGLRGGSTTNPGGNIDGWTAYRRGYKKGDTFLIERTGKGEFRDSTRGENIPQRGFIKWILSHYPDSHAATILTTAGKTA